MWGIAAFLALPIIEIILFIQIGGEIGVIGVLVWLALAAAAGVFLLRQTGMQSMASLRSTLEAGGQDLGRNMVERALTLAAAVLLILPGFFTDFVAVLLLLPPVRGLIYDRLRSRIAVSQFGVNVTRRDWADPDADIIDGDYHPVDQDGPKLPRH